MIGLRPNSERKMKRTLTDIYFKPKSFERWRNGRIYEYLGVKHAKKSVFVFGRLIDRITGQDKVCKERGVDNTYRGPIKDLRDIVGLEKAEKFTRVAESIHLSFAVGLTTLGFIHLPYDHIEPSSGLIIGLFNLYLVFLQRYNRQRINNLIDKKQKYDQRFGLESEVI